MNNNKKLAKLTLELFSMLESREVSDFEREFSPTTIQTCRVQHQMKLAEIMPKIKQLAEEINNE